MKRTTALVCGFVVVLSLVVSAQPAEACGAAGEAACWEKYCLVRIAGKCIVSGWRLEPPNLGCDERTNNIFNTCQACGGAGQLVCVLDPPMCNTDRRYTPAVVCIPCGQDKELVCLSSPMCDPHNRIVYGFCSDSGHSEEPGCDCSVEVVLPQPPGRPVRGFADVHAHQFSNLGFGGAGFWGATHHEGGIDKALPWCDWTWDFPIIPGVSLSPDFHPTLGFKAHGTMVHQFADCNPLLDWFGGVSISCGSHEGVHETSGTGPFEGWPKWSTTTHQQMYYRWLERAYKGGLRLLVNLAVNNQAACVAMGQRWLNCKDMYNIDKQIDGAYSLEAFIDDEHDGPGTGWYRIVTSPAEARQVIEDGKLAVVLGIETDFLFGCKPGPLGVPLSECTANFIRGQVEKYHCKGVRHVFPVHLYNNRYSGSGLYNSLWTVANIALTGDLMDARDCSEYPNPADPESLKYNYTTDWHDFGVELIKFLYGWAFPGLDDWEGMGAQCNRDGLSTEGEWLVEDLMDYGMIIDVDHLSLIAMNKVLDLAESESYPLISGHSFLFDEPTMEFGNFARTEIHKTEEQIKRIRDLGGVIAPLNPCGKCSSTLDYVRKYEYIVEQMRGGPYYDPVEDIPRIAFATDFGGFFQQTAPRDPRESGDVCPDAKYEAQKYDPEGNSIYHVGTPATLMRPDDYPLLGYPFKAVGGFGWFSEQQTGSRVFDFNEDGLAHVGLLPDFLADLRNVGLTDTDLEPLMYSAEAYIRMWEQIDDSGGQAVPRVVAQIDGTEGAGGWYLSDVVVSWHDQCDAETITEDTTGVDVSCTAESACGPVTTSVRIQRDATPPVVTGSRILNPEPPAGWFKEPVNVEFEAEDLMSGLVGESPMTVPVIGEGQDMVASHTFRDQAGNTVLAEHGGINIDLTPPFVGFRFEHAPNLPPDEFALELEKWHNHDIVFLVVAEDELSGVASVDPERLVVSTEGISVAGSATATDVAGNSSTVTSPSVKIDKTPPTIAFVSRLPEANQHGWSNSPITVTWSCQDTLSGVVEAEITQTLSTEGADQSLMGQCVDQAGNIAEDTVTGLNLDMTPPLLACAADPSEIWPANHKMVPVTIAIDFSDPISGTDGFWLTAIASSEPDSGNRGDKPNDIQGFDVGIDDTGGELRAERDGEGPGRIYTLQYAAQDMAGNGATCATAVGVPHDQGKGKGKD